MSEEGIEALLVSLFAAMPKEARQEAVRAVIEKLGLAKSEVARMMGVTPSAVTRFVRGDAAPSPESLARLFLALEPDERSIVAELLIGYVTSLVRSLRMLFETGLLEGDSRSLEVMVEELVDAAMLLLEMTGGYRGAHSSQQSQLGERFSSKPPSFSRLRSRL